MKLRTVDEGRHVLYSSDTTAEDKATIVSAFQLKEYLSLDSSSLLAVNRFRSHGVTSMRDRTGAVITGKRKDAKELTDVFYNFIATTRPITEALTDSITLYRAVRVKLTDGQNEHMELLPSSTSWSLDFCKRWVSELKSEYTIFEITVPLSFPLLFSSFSDSPSRYRFSDHINQAQSEVLLAPSKLTFTESIKHVDGYNVQPCTAQELGRDQAKLLIDSVESKVSEKEVDLEDDWED